MHYKKAPRFYQQQWSLVEEDVWRSAKISIGMSVTMIHLIPKFSHANSATEFRSIARRSTIYKIISKILANRLQDILPFLINDARVGFVKGCQIVDNVFLAHEILRGCG